MNFITVFISFVVSFLLVTAAPESHAARIRVKHGTEDLFTMLAPINLSSEATKQLGLPENWVNSQLALRTQLHWMVIPYKTENLGLVIHNPGAKEFWPASPVVLRALQNIGALPQPLPTAKPSFMNTALGINISIAGVLLACILLGYLSVYIEKRKRQRLIAQVNAVTHGQFLPLLREILLNIAHADGVYNQKKKPVIANILAQYGHGQEDVNSMLADESRTAHLDNRTLKAYLRCVTKQLSQDQISLIVHAIVAVVVADGEAKRSEKRQLREYLEALGVSKKQSPRMLKKLLQNAVPAT